MEITTLSVRHRPSAVLSARRTQSKLDKANRILQRQHEILLEFVRLALEVKEAADDFRYAPSDCTPGDPAQMWISAAIGWSRLDSAISQLSCLASPDPPVAQKVLQIRTQFWRKRNGRNQKRA